MFASCGTSAAPRGLGTEEGTEDDADAYIEKEHDTVAKSPEEGGDGDGIGRSDVSGSEGDGCGDTMGRVKVWSSNPGEKERDGGLGSEDGREVVEGGSG